MIKSMPEKELIEFYEKRNKINFFYTRFNFLSAHLGIRPACLHGLVGTMGSGKSTLFKTIVADTARTQKVLVWLTEESVTEYSSKLSIVGDVNVTAENVSFFEERDLKINPQALDKLYDYLELKINETQSKVVFVDNITTGLIYSDDLGVGGQSKSARMLLDLTKRMGVAVFYLAHTTSSTRDNMTDFMSGENVRGSKNITMRSEYLYGMQKVTTENMQVNFIRIIKHRHHDIADKNYILLWENGLYYSDKKCKFEDIKELVAMREKLK